MDQFQVDGFVYHGSIDLDTDGRPITLPQGRGVITFRQSSALWWWDVVDSDEATCTGGPAETWFLAVKQAYEAIAPEFIG